MYIILAILMFSFLIVIHELGHFVTAKLSGVQVNEFSVFMGPAIFKKQIGQTLYSVRCIPFGGYCAMEGEDDNSDNPRSFGKAAWWKRLIILVAGAAMNFLCGFLIFYFLFGPSSGIEALPEPVISGFYQGNTIEGASGLQVGDEFYSIDGERVYTSSNIPFLLSMNLSEEPGFHDLSMNLSEEPGFHDIVVIRNGEKVYLDGFPMERTEVQTENGVQMLYGMKLATVPRTFASSMKFAWNNSIDTVRMVRMSLKMLISGQAGLKDVGGPVMIVQAISETAESSGSTRAAMRNVLSFTAFIAVNLAVMNLLPIPALDGGRALCVILTTIVETITHKKLNPKYEAYLHGAGMVVLLGFMALITFKDIFNIFRG